MKAGISPLSYVSVTKCHIPSSLACTQYQPSPGIEPEISWLKEWHLCHHDQQSPWLKSQSIPTLIVAISGWPRKRFFFHMGNWTFHIWRRHLTIELCIQLVYRSLNTTWGMHNLKTTQMTLHLSVPMSQWDTSVARATWCLIAFYSLFCMVHPCVFKLSIDPIIWHKGRLYQAF